MKTSDGTALVPLPPVEVIQIPITLRDEARKLYDAVEDFSRMRIERAMTAQGGFTTAVRIQHRIAYDGVPQKLGISVSRSRVTH
jgi:hypothetical protein